MQYRTLKLSLGVLVTEVLSAISGGMPALLSKTTAQGERGFILWYKQKVSRNNCCFAVKFTILTYSEYTWADTWDRSVYFLLVKCEKQWPKHPISLPTNALSDCSHLKAQAMWLGENCLPLCVCYWPKNPHQWWLIEKNPQFRSITFKR